MGNTSGSINQGRHLTVDIFFDELITLSIEVIQPQRKNIEAVSDIIMNHHSNSFPFFFLGLDVFQN